MFQIFPAWALLQNIAVAELKKKPCAKGEQELGKHGYWEKSNQTKQFQEKSGIPGQSGSGIKEWEIDSFSHTLNILASPEAHIPGRSLNCRLF